MAASMPTQCPEAHVRRRGPASEGILSDNDRPSRIKSVLSAVKSSEQQLSVTSTLFIVAVPAVIGRWQRGSCVGSSHRQWSALVVSSHPLWRPQTRYYTHRLSVRPSVPWLCRSLNVPTHHCADVPFNWLARSNSCFYFAVTCVSFCSVSLRSFHMPTHLLCGPPLGRITRYPVQLSVCPIVPEFVTFGFKICYNSWILTNF